MLAHTVEKKGTDRTDRINTTLVIQSVLGLVTAITIADTIRECFNAVRPSSSGSAVVARLILVVLVLVGGYLFYQWHDERNNDGRRLGVVDNDVSDDGSDPSTATTELTTEGAAEEVTEPVETMRGGRGFMGSGMSGSIWCQRSGGIRVGNLDGRDRATVGYLHSVYTQPRGSCNHGGVYDLGPAWQINPRVVGE